MDNPAQQQPQQQAAIPQKVMSIEKILARHGRVVLQLEDAQEELVRGQGLINHFQAKIKEAAEKIQALTDDLEAEKALHTAALSKIAEFQEKLAKYEPQPKAVEEGPQRETAN